MLKQFLDAIGNSYIELQEDGEKIDQWMDELSDKMIVWMVSLATGSAVLLISYSDRVKVTKTSLNLTLGVLLISIVAGVISRYYHLTVARLYRDLLSTFKFQIRQEQMHFYPQQLDENDTAETVYYCIHSDLGVDLKPISNISDIHEFKEKYSDEAARRLYDSLVVYCRAMYKEAKDRTDKIIDDTLQTTGNEEARRLTKEQVDAKHHKYKLFEGACLISFLFAVIFITIAYIVHW